MSKSDYCNSVVVVFRPVARHSSIEGCGEGVSPFPVGDGLCPLPRKFWDFHWKWLILAQIPLYILVEMLGYLLLGPSQQYRGGGLYCWRLTGTLTAGLWAVTSPEIFGSFSLEMAHFILVQIQLYFNGNVRQFTARTTTVTCTAGG